MCERTCPCNLAELELGDPRREPIMDCFMGESTRWPCIKFKEKQPTETESNQKPPIVQGAERHTGQGTLAYYSITHPIKIA